MTVSLVFVSFLVVFGNVDGRRGGHEFDDWDFDNSVDFEDAAVTNECPEFGPMPPFADEGLKK